MLSNPSLASHDCKVCFSVGLTSVLFVEGSGGYSGNDLAGLRAMKFRFGWVTSIACIFVARKLEMS